MNSQDMFGGEIGQKKAHPPRRKFIYECTNCGTQTDRSDLMVKRAVFKTIGEYGKTVRSRTTAWLCPACLKADTDWNMKKLSSAPGLADMKAE